jgi:hypothetical protein
MAYDRVLQMTQKEELIESVAKGLVATRLSLLV